MDWMHTYGLVRRMRAMGFAMAMGAALVASGPALGVEPLYYDARGNAHRLIKSPDEFVVEFDRQDIAGSAERVRHSGTGSLSPVPWNTGNARFQIHKVARANRARRDALRTLRGVQSVHPVYRFEGRDTPFLSSGRLAVKLIAGLSETERDQLFQDYGLGDVKPVEGLANVYTARPVMDPDEDEVTCAAALHLDDRTVYAQPDFRSPAVLCQAIPDDPLYGQQWHLDNNGQNGGTPGADIDVFEAWGTSLGADVIIGIFDDAVDVDHEDLRGNYLDIGHDAADGSDDPRPKQIGDRHGTACLGLICAESNDLGVRGVAPLARFTASASATDLITDAARASAWTFARQQGVDVHNNSWEIPPGFPDPPIVVDAIETAFVEGRGGRGMVVLFSSGNDDRKIQRGFALATLPTVIAVGGSSPIDTLYSLSNYGPEVDVLAPTADDGYGYGIVTTDNDDGAGYVEPGYNNEGVSDDGFPNLTDPSYTNDFGGTSASCPIASGIAALCLSVNPDLTATQVRCILEHTAVPIDADEAEYDVVTRRSERYGYGKVNASAAVLAADQSSTNGGITWPNRLADVEADPDTDKLSWSKNDDLRTVQIEGDDVTLGDRVTRVLVLQSTQPIVYFPPEGSFVPNPITDEDCVGFEVNTNASFVQDCENDPVATGSGIYVAQNNNSTSFTFDDSGGTLYFALFAANAAGRYSWGVLVDSNNNVVGNGETIDTGGGGGGGGDGGVVIPVGSEIPKVTIAVSPSSGYSPLTVQFQANALSDTAVISTVWDFGDGSPIATERSVTHTYDVPDGTAQTYIATHTATDEEGDVGSRSFAVNILANTTEGGSGDPISVTILVETPGAPGSDRDSGTSPFEVNLSFDTENLADGLVITSVLWDLGDGTTSSSLSVPHTYYNTGTASVTIPITLRLTFRDVYGQTIIANPATRLITVLPGEGADNSNDNSTGGSDVPTGRSPTAGDQRLCGVACLYGLPALFLWALVRRRN